jgi:outer membrane protein
MPKIGLVLLTLACALRAEVHNMTLRQAVELSVKQNPDIALARLDEEKARAAIGVARGPFMPRIVVGSGLAYSNGFPMSIEGSAPSVVQANAQQFLFNRQQSFQVAQAREDARGAALAVLNKRDEVAYRTAALYLDAERFRRIAALAQKAVESRQKVLDTVRAQVLEGRALPLAEKQAALALALARQSIANLDDQQASAETMLAVALGYSAGDRVRPVEEERSAPHVPKSEEAAVQSALQSNKELRQLESQILAKQLEMRGERAARLPRADLVAQYAMMAKFNNYAEFFNRFQRNNGQIGMSLQFPLFSPGVGAQVAQTQTELSRLKVELNNARNRLSSDLQQSFRDVKKASAAGDVARLDLDVARAQLDVDLALMQEGRLSLRQVEEARLSENDKWIAFYDARYTLEKARWNVLRLTGDLLPSVEALPAAR